MTGPPKAGRGGPTLPLPAGAAGEPSSPAVAAVGARRQPVAVRRRQTGPPSPPGERWATERSGADRKPPARPERSPAVPEAARPAGRRRIRSPESRRIPVTALDAWARIVPAGGTFFPVPPGADLDSFPCNRIPDALSIRDARRAADAETTADDGTDHEGNRRDKRPISPPEADRRIPPSRTTRPAARARMRDAQARQCAIPQHWRL